MNVSSDDDAEDALNNRGFKNKKKRGGECKSKSKSKSKSTSNWWEWLGVSLPTIFQKETLLSLSGEVAGCDVTAD